MRSTNLKFGVVLSAAFLVLSLPGKGLAQDPYLARLLPPPSGFTLSSVQKKAVTSALNATQERELNRIGRLLSRNPLSSRWEALITGTKGTKVDVGALMQWVLRQAYLEGLEDLGMYAEKVKNFNEDKQGLRDELTRARRYSQSSRTPQASFYPDTVVWRLLPQIYRSSVLPQDEIPSAGGTGGDIPAMNVPDLTPIAAI